MYTRLPHIVTIQSKTTSSWKGATYTTTWSGTATIWANVSLKEKSSSTENYDNFKGQQFDYYSVIIRNGTTISKINNRLLFDSKILHIQTIKDKSNRNRYRELICRCEEVV